MFRFLDISTYYNRLGIAFKALQVRNFRLFFWGQLASLLGTWIQNLALGWLIYRLSGSPFLLGLVGFAGQIPSLVLTPLAGVFADRTNRQKVLFLVQCVSMLMAFTLALLTLTGSIQVWHIIAIAIINGMAMAFDTPYRHSFLLDMVGDKMLLQNAIALNSTLINSARFIGPLLGGILIAAVGEGYCFLINGISFFAIIAALLAMKVEKPKILKVRKNILVELFEGFKYSYNSKPIRYLLLLVFSSSLFGLPFQVFLPYYASNILAGDASLLGILTGLFGAGALLGAIFLATRTNMSKVIDNILLSALIFSLFLVVFAISNLPWLSFFALPFVGFGMIVLFASTNTYLQSTTESSVRGRVISLYGMSFMGITPLGSLLLGWASKVIRTEYALLISAFICLAIALLLREKVKRNC